MAPRQEKLHPSQTHYLSNDSSHSLNPNDTAWDSERALREYKDRWLNSFGNNTNRPVKKVDNDKARREAEAVKLREEGYRSEDIEKILAGEPKSKFKTRGQIEAERKAEEQRIKDSIDNANRRPPKPREKTEEEKKRDAVKQLIEDNKPKVNSRVDI